MNIELVTMFVCFCFEMFFFNRVRIAFNRLKLQPTGILNRD